MFNIPALHKAESTFRAVREPSILVSAPDLSAWRVIWGFILSLNRWHCYLSLIPGIVHTILGNSERYFDTDVCWASFRRLFPDRSKLLKGIYSCITSFSSSSQATGTSFAATLVNHHVAVVHEKNIAANETLAVTSTLKSFPALSFRFLSTS